MVNCHRCEVKEGVFECAQCGTSTADGDVEPAVYCAECSDIIHQGRLKSHVLTSLVTKNPTRSLEEMKREMQDALVAAQLPGRDIQTRLMEIRCAKDNLNEQKKMYERNIYRLVNDLHKVMKEKAKDLRQEVQEKFTEKLTSIAEMEQTLNSQLDAMKQFGTEMTALLETGHDGIVAVKQQLEEKSKEEDLASLTQKFPSVQLDCNIDCSPIYEAISQLSPTISTPETSVKLESKVKEGHKMPVFVSAPMTRQGHLVISWPLEDQTINALTRLSASIRDNFIANGGLTTFSELDKRPESGQLIYVLHGNDRKWYRAQVEEHRPDKGMYSVQLLDYGCSIFTSTPCMVPIEEDLFPDVAYQSVECTLFTEAQSNLPAEPRWWFNDLVQSHNTIECTFKHKLDDSQNIWFIEMEYVDTGNGDKVININEELQNRLSQEVRGDKPTILCRDIRLKDDPGLLERSRASQAADAAAKAAVKAQEESTAEVNGESSDIVEAEAVSCKVDSQPEAGEVSVGNGDGDSIDVNSEKLIEKTASKDVINSDKVALNGEPNIEVCTDSVVANSLTDAATCETGEIQRLEESIPVNEETVSGVPLHNRDIPSHIIESPQRASNSAQVPPSMQSQTESPRYSSPLQRVDGNHKPTPDQPKRAITFDETETQYAASLHDPSIVNPPNMYTDAQISYVNAHASVPESDFRSQTPDLVQQPPSDFVSPPLINRYTWDQRHAERGCENPALAAAVRPSDLATAPAYVAYPTPPEDVKMVINTGMGYAGDYQGGDTDDDVDDACVLNALTSPVSPQKVQLYCTSYSEREDNDNTNTAKNNIQRFDLNRLEDTSSDGLSDEYEEDRPIPPPPRRSPAKEPSIKPLSPTQENYQNNVEHQSTNSTSKKKRKKKRSQSPERTPDSELLPRVELKAGTAFKARVASNVDNKGIFSVTLPRTPEQEAHFKQFIGYLQDIGQLSSDCSDISEGTRVFVKDDRSHTWHRGIIHSLLPAKKAQVRLIDIGKSINVPHRSIKDIPEKLLSSPPQACWLCLERMGPSDITEGAQNEFRRLTRNKELLVHVERTCGDDQPAFASVYSTEPPLNISEQVVHFVPNYYDSLRPSLILMQTYSTPNISQLPVATAQPVSGHEMSNAPNSDIDELARRNDPLYGSRLYNDGPHMQYENEMYNEEEHQMMQGVLDANRQATDWEPISQGSSGSGRMMQGRLEMSDNDMRYYAHSDSSNSSAGFAGDQRSACFGCGQPGHVRRDCPVPRRNQDERVCFRCKGTGHLARDCPQSAGGSEAICFKCNGIGHYQGDCPQRRKGHGHDRGNRGRMEHHGPGPDRGSRQEGGGRSYNRGPRKDGPPRSHRRDHRHDDGHYPPASNDSSHGEVWD